jgi:hypothetical protein
MAQQLRKRIDKWDYMKLKTFCTTKEMISKLKGYLQSKRKLLPAVHQMRDQNTQGAQKTKLPQKSMTQ